jgi:hypothetical protein
MFFLWTIRIQTPQKKFALWILYIIQSYIEGKNRMLKFAKADEGALTRGPSAAVMHAKCGLAHEKSYSLADSHLLTSLVPLYNKFPSQSLAVFLSPLEHVQHSSYRHCQWIL